MAFLKPFEITPINDVCLNNSEKHFHVISGTPYFMDVSLDCAKFQKVSVTIDRAPSIEIHQLINANIHGLHLSWTEQPISEIFFLTKESSQIPNKSPSCRTESLFGTNERFRYPTVSIRVECERLRFKRSWCMCVFATTTAWVIA